MRARVLVMAVLMLVAALAALLVTGVLPSPFAPPSVTPWYASDPDASGGVEDEAAAARRTAMRGRPGEPGETRAPAAEEVVPAEVRGTAAPRGGGVVRGRVVRGGEAKVPVEGVTVRLLRPDSLFTYLRARREGRYDDLVARTGADGRFAFRDVLPATGYVAWAQPATDAAATSEEVEVLARGTHDVGDLALGRSGTIGGRVTDEAGAPVAGARIAVTWLVSNEFDVVLADEATLPWIERRAVTDADGRWSAAALEPGTKTLVVGAASGAAEAREGIEVKDGEVLTDVDVTLKGSSWISGIVVGESAGAEPAPLAGARVFAKLSTGVTARTMDTGADGTFRLGPLGEGKYQVGAMVEGLPVQMKIVASGSTDVRLTFPASGSLSGTVVSATTGRPIRAFRVTPVFLGKQDMMARFVSKKVQAVLGPSGFSSDAGAFRFHRLPAGPHLLVVEADGHPRTEVPDVTVVVGAETVAPPIALPDGHVIAGVVVDSTGKPVAGARVAVEPISRVGIELVTDDEETVEWDAAELDGRSADALTDDAGRFETSLLTPTRYRVVASVAGRVPGTIDSVDVVAASRRDVRVVLPAGGAIRVRLLDPDGRPAVGQSVVFVREDGTTSFQSAGEDGACDLSPALAGRWALVWASASVLSSSPAQTSAERRFDVVRALPGAVETDVAEGVERTLSLRTSRLVRLVGVARLEGKPPQPGASIYLSAGGWRSATTDAEGRFAYDMIEPTSAVLYLHVPAGEGQPGAWVHATISVPDVLEHRVEVDFKR